MAVPPPGRFIRSVRKEVMLGKESLWIELSFVSVRNYECYGN